MQSKAVSAGWFTTGCLAVMLMCVGTAAAQTGVSANAPGVDFYVGLTESCCGEDPHPVHGIATDDGGYLSVGKTVSSGDGWGGFAVKIGPPDPMGIGVLLEPDESASVHWTIQLGGGSGKSALLNAASAGDAVFLAGLRSDATGQPAMYLAKHDTEDGSLIWEKRFVSPGGHSAIEAIQVTSDGGLIAVGVSDAPEGGLEGFKSFGNPFGGKAHAFYLSPTQVASDSAPDSPTWARDYSGYETAKAVRVLPGQSNGFIILVGQEEAPPGLMRVDDSGDPIWQQSYPGRFEATDVALHRVDGVHQGYTFTGHGGDKGTIDGQLTRVDLNGDVAWTQTFGDPAGGVGPFDGLGPGDPQLIFDECWGIQGLPDGGAIVGCGTGIEGCDVVTDSALEDLCKEDPRRTWRGYVVRFDEVGQSVWHRVDSFVEEGADDGVPDAASEYIALLPDGGFLSIVDQGFGLGLMKLSPENPSGTSLPEEEPRDPSEEVEPEDESETERDDDEGREGDDDQEVEGDDDQEVEGDDDQEVEGDDDQEVEGDDDPEAAVDADGDGCNATGPRELPALVLMGLALCALMVRRKLMSWAS
ncbi:MAG: hypothetical protein ACPGU1_19140 [Myxococcota bacterium]